MRLTLIALLGLAGCAANYGKNPADSSSSHTPTVVPLALHLMELPVFEEKPNGAGHDANDISSHLFGVEGTVESRVDREGQLRYLTIRVGKSLPNSVGYDPFAEERSKAVKVFFDERLRNFEKLDLRNGSEVMVWMGYIDDTQAVWGSNSHWIAAKNGRRFLRDDGSPVDADLLFPHFERGATR